MIFKNEQFSSKSSLRRNVSARLPIWSASYQQLTIKLFIQMCSRTHPKQIQPLNQIETEKQANVFIVWQNLVLSLKGPCKLSNQVFTKQKEEQHWKAQSNLHELQKKKNWFRKKRKLEGTSTGWGSVTEVKTKVLNKSLRFLQKTLNISGEKNP